MANNGNMLQSGVHRPSSAYESSVVKHEQLWYVYETNDGK